MSLVVVFPSHEAFRFRVGRKMSHPDQHSTCRSATAFPLVILRTVGPRPRPLCCFQQRGGRHEVFLEMLNLNGFHVRALDPTCADDLRARVSGDDSKGSRRCGSRIGGGSATAAVGDGVGAGGAAAVRTGCKGGKWPGPEWKRGSLPAERRKIHLNTPTDSETATRRGRGGGRESAADSPANRIGEALAEDVAGGGIGHLVAPGARKGNRRGNDDAACSAKHVRLGGGEKEGGGGGWGYKDSGLGKILAFAVRRRDSFDGDHDDDDDRGVGGGS